MQNIYKNFTLRKLNNPAFTHLKLLFYWPIYGIVFFSMERLLPLNFHVVYSRLDDYIPFCEWFLIPYLAWFVYMIGMHFYLGFTDIPLFRKYMWYIILSYTMTVLIFAIYPTSQLLRPEVMPRDNALTRFIAGFYEFDTNTNVCPSLHVIGMMAVTFAGFHCKKMQTVGWRIFWVISTLLVCFSTVFLKQHSIIDIFVGFIVAFFCYWLSFYKLPIAGRKLKNVAESIE